MSGNEGRTLETTETSVDILETVRESEGASLTELQEQMEIPKSTLYYHLNTLEKRGLLVREANEYHLGMKFVVYGQSARTRKDEYELAQETTHQLANQLDEDVDFSVEEQGQIIVLHHTVGESGKHGYSFELKQTINMPTTASGRAILAEYPESRVSEIVSRWGFQGTEDAPTDEAALADRLEKIRERGFAINDEEWMDGLCAVSSAVKYPDGSVLGALSVIIPSFRFDAENVDDLVTPLLNEVAQLEERIEARQRR